VLRIALVVVLLAAVWAVVVVLALPLWIAVGVTLLAAGVLAALWLVRRRRSRLASKEIERALHAQAAEQMAVARPDQRGEIEAMQREFRRAVESLRSSKLGKRGYDALYALPWYVIVGPPGAGKTTALRSSGLSFPHLSREQAGLRGVGGTRNCDWWLSNEAVLIDTAGRYTSEEADREEWFGFLDMLREQRSRRPINGVLVAIGADEVGGLDSAGLDVLGRTLRDRIDELMTRLEMTAPVYLLVTKCDLLPGFVETFGALSKAERRQIWGFTYPATGAATPGAEARFCEHFDELGEALDRVAQQRLAGVRRVDHREKILGFPQQLQALREPLRELVGHVFSENSYRETPPLRGVYLTSGTQEGRPIDRVLAAMGNAFGIAAQRILQEPARDPKSYFLGDLFAEVVFPDQELAVRSVVERRRQRRAQWSAAAAILTVAALASTLPGYAYVGNAGIIAGADEALADIEAYHAERRLSADLPLGKIEGLRALADTLAIYHDDRPLALRFGMFIGEALRRPVDALYAAVLRSDLLLPALEADAVRLRALVVRHGASASQPTRGEFVRAHAQLKLHLLLTAPASGAQPALDNPAVRAFLQLRLAEHWGGPGGSARPEAVQKLERHLRTFVALAAEDPGQLLLRDETLVAEVRAILGRKPLVELTLERMITEGTRVGYDLSAREIMGSVAPWVTAGRTVRGAFTRPGWEQIVRDELAMPATAEAEPWVLGLSQAELDARDQTLRDTLESQYFERYIDEWRRFIDDIAVTPPVSRMDALLMLQDLSRGAPPPYARLLRAVAYHTRLEYPALEPEAGADDVLGKLGEVAQAQGEKQLAKKTGKAGTALLGGLRGSEGAGSSDDPRLLADDVRASFAGLARFGAPPRTPPVAEGSEATPPVTLDLDIYQEQLIFLRDALQAYLDEPARSEELMNRLQAARTRVRGLIEAQQVGWRPRFEALLWPPLAGLGEAIQGDVAGGVARKWCSEVVAPHDRTLRARYPFAADATQDATLADFAAFYKPGEGTLWSFYDKVLQRPVPREGDEFIFSRQLGRDLSQVFVAGLPGYLTAARDVSSVMFPPGGAGPLVEFDVQISPTPGVEVTALMLGKQQVSHRNGPEKWQRVRWPAEGDDQAATLVVEGRGFREVVHQEGDWGLFRLLERGKVRGSAESGLLTATWVFADQGGLTVAIKIRPARAESPFFGVPGRAGGGLLAPLRASALALPRALAAAAVPCPLPEVKRPAKRRKGKQDMSGRTGDP